MNGRPDAGYQEFVAAMANGRVGAEGLLEAFDLQEKDPTAPAEQILTETPDKLSLDACSYYLGVHLNTFRKFQHGPADTKTVYIPRGRASIVSIGICWTGRASIPRLQLLNGKIPDEAQLLYELKVGDSITRCLCAE